MTPEQTSSKPQPGFFETLRNDLTRQELPKAIRTEYREVSDFFLTDERKARLGLMHPINRALHIAGWLLMALFFKLNPIRRLLLIAALLLLFQGRVVYNFSDHFTASTDFGFIGGALLLFVLLLELKDKLLAHDELTAGHAIQRALMPETSPPVPGWSLWLFTRPANDVGGDFVDFQALGKETYGISLGDVAGKGLQAALLTAKLQATLRALAPDIESFPALAASVNRILHRDSPRNLFASMICLRIKEESGEVRLVNAGHFPPLLVRREGQSSLRKGDPGFGIFPEAAYSEEMITLGHGEFILVYSDGLTDTKNEAGGFFDFAHLTSLLPAMRDLTAPQIGERIVQMVDQFRGDAKPYDDLSLAIIRRT